MVSVLFAFGSAFANSLNLVTQHVASTAAPATVRGWRLARYLVRNPLWLLGVGATVAAFVLQALALYHGRLSVVQSILVTELVFTLVIGRVWLRRPVAAAAWVSASVTSAGLALFLGMSEPKGGHPQATAAAWLPVLLTFGGASAVLTFFARGGSPVRRAALYATASGIVWALFATFLKSVTDVLGASGVRAVLGRGAIYGLIVAAIAGTVLTQAALHYGPLRVSQPLMVIVDPVVSIVLGIWLFGEHFEGSPWTTAFGAAGFAAMAAGVVCLARTAPSLEAAPAPVPPSTA
ncbi:MAG TPA: DMT family transporter [Acidimicrobiales bacterium]|nr:DMT family transporter [Acidimicrobiales bacterium]